MKLNLGIDSYSGEEILIKSPNKVIIKSSIGGGKTFVALNILKNLAYSGVDVSAYIEGSYPQNIVKDLMGIKNAYATLYSRLNLILDSLYELMEERKTADEDENFKPVVYILDGLNPNDTTEAQLFQLDRVLLEKLNIHLILTLNVSPRQLDDVLTQGDTPLSECQSIYVSKKKPDFNPHVNTEYLTLDLFFKHFKSSEVVSTGVDLPII